MMQNEQTGRETERKEKEEKTSQQYQYKELSDIIQQIRVLESSHDSYITFYTIRNPSA